MKSTLSGNMMPSLALGILLDYLSFCETSDKGIPSTVHVPWNIRTWNLSDTSRTMEYPKGESQVILI